MGNIDRKFVEKPWGGEVWLVHNEHYVLKHLYLNPNEELSLQYHNEKHETMMILHGMGEMITGNDGEAEEHSHKSPVHIFSITEGDIIPIKPKTIHKVRAITPLKILEVSTPHTEDLVRVADKYGR